ncbi:molybdopterin-dependent oxidoreductase, partial [Psychrobacter sp. 16-Bac2893]
HGVDDALAAANVWSIEKVAQACQVSIDSILEFYQLVAAHDKTVTAFSMGVNQSKSGTDKVNAIINTHLLTGRVGKPGASPFSLTGQPNAMGGREVGALANLLAAHLDLDNSIHRQWVADFWQAPQPIAPEVGIQACDAADAILDGRIKAIWIMATNPVVSLPDADKFRRALAACDLVIVSDCSVDSDTVKCADIVLPAQGWGEKSGTVTNSERRISRQRAVKPALGLAKPDWWILSQVARRMGLSGFDY